MEAYFIGIDVGTQGARVVLLDTEGRLKVSKEEVFTLSSSSREEQSPVMWWDCCLELLKAMIREAGADTVSKIISIGVTSTSGTVIPLDENNIPVHHAMMYSDKRSEKVSRKCTQAALKFHNKGFTAFNSSTGLAKMVWFVETYPEETRKISKWVHASDYITGKLSGVWGVTDYTNAFKSGFDITGFYWPGYLSDELGLHKEWLPKVVPTGAVIGEIDKNQAVELGLTGTIKITSGLTDGCASQIASGAVNLGDWNTTIGTTLVVKGVTQSEILDPHGRIYTHRHPQGFWMPGGASNTGADWVTQDFSDDFTALNYEAMKLLPTGYLNYPLRQQGERFPLNAPQALGFKAEGLTRTQEFTANMEGVAFIERYAYELIEQLSGEKVSRIFTAGGASNSEVWLKIRASVLNKPIYKMKHVSGAVGAAISAASNTYFSNLTEAAKALTIIEKEVLPEKKLTEEYQGLYLKFVNLLTEKGFLTHS
jgi:sugar (pentulose or hexulose) kinase